MDYLNVIDLIKGDDCEEHPLCKMITIEMKLEMCHTLREGNRCADAMVKLGVNQMRSFAGLPPCSQCGERPY